jgi:hypothetical protein
MLEIDPPRVSASQIANQFLKRRRALEGILLNHPQE